MCFHGVLFNFTLWVTSCSVPQCDQGTLLSIKCDQQLEMCVEGGKSPGSHWGEEFFALIFFFGFDFLSTACLVLLSLFI